MKKNAEKYVLVAGCGRMGANIASLLSSRGHHVVVVDLGNASSRKLSPAFNGFFLEGDATDIDVLARAGIAKADIVVAATNDDNVNIMISEIASAVFKVPKVISRLYDTEKQNVYQNFNVNIIYPSMLSLAEFEKIAALPGMEEVS